MADHTAARADLVLKYAARNRKTKIQSTEPMAKADRGSRRCESKTISAIPQLTFSRMDGRIIARYRTP
jgi:hypothetical protein